jgi:NitT/TauT family transport system substrate-binding protein
MVSELEYTRRGVLGLAAGAAASVAVPAGARAQTPPLRVSVATADAYAEGYFAADQGFFTQAQLNVSLSMVGSGANAATMAAANALDMGISNTANLAIAITHGAPFKIIAGGGLYTAKRPTTAVVTAIDSPVRSVHDLVGKVVAVTALKDLTEVGVRVWLDRNGVDSRSVKFVETPMGLMTAALSRGTFDAALVGEPYLSDGVGKTMRVVGDAYATIAPQFLIANWFTTTGFLKQNLPLVKRFVATIYDTARWANAHEAEAGQILGKYSKMDPATLTRMTRCIYATSLEPRYLDSVLSVMYNYGALDKRLTSGDLVANLA